MSKYKFYLQTLFVFVLFNNLPKRIGVFNYLRKINLIKCSGNGDLSSVNVNSNKMCCIRAALIAGCYPNLIKIDKINNRLLNE